MEGGRERVGGRIVGEWRRVRKEDKWKRMKRKRGKRKRGKGKQGGGGRSQKKGIINKDLSKQKKAQEQGKVIKTCDVGRYALR